MEIKVLKDILDANEQMALSNRDLLEKQKILCLNIMSSPGSGKTTLIMETIKRIKDEYQIGVIEGDIASSIDAEKIASLSIPVVQINTGGGCHLDANSVKSALHNLPLSSIKLLLIENVGNLICPGEFNLGESKKIVLLSVPEGDDKPFKYPLIFSIADVVLITKIDLLPYFDFHLDNFIKVVTDMNQKAKIFPLSSKTGEGIQAWIDWLKASLLIIL